VTETWNEEPIDLPTIYQERRPVFCSALLALSLLAVFQNWWDRNSTAGLNPGDWLLEDLSILPMAICTVFAGWARPMWMQAAASIALLALLIVFMFAYAIPGA
jgi:hypothetical protein